MESTMKFTRRRESLLGAAFLGAGLFLSACSGGSGTPSPVSHATMSGKVMGGQQPVVGATVTISSVGTSGYGTGASSLGSAVTDSSGNWSIDISACPSSTLAYVTATGGNAGSGANSALGLAAVLGTCGTASGLTNVNINEVTTVATVYALSQFLDSATASNVGSSSTNATGLSNAFGTFTNLADIATGLSPAGLPSYITSPAATVYSLANLIAACVNSAGGVAGDGSACGTLFTAATPSGGTAPTTTLQALLDIAQNPGNNVASLYTDSGSSTVFAGSLTAAPNDWTLALLYAPTDMVGEQPSTASQNTSSYGLAIDASGNAWATLFDGTGVYELSPTGRELSSTGGYNPGSALLDTWGLAIDPQGNVWVANAISPSANNSGFGTIVKLSPTGTDLSSGGYAPILTSSATYIGNPSAIAFQPVATSVDPNGFVAYVAQYNNQQDLGKASVVGLSSTGATTAGETQYTDLNVFAIKALAIDGNSNIWVADERTSSANVKGGVTKVPESIIGSSTQPGAEITSTFNGPYSVAVDSSNNLWLPDFGAFNGGNAVIVLSGTTNSIIHTYSVGASKSDAPVALVMDGGGTVWIANQKYVLSGATNPTYTGGVLKMNSATGALIGPALGLTGSSASGTAPVQNPSNLAIDASGNMWMGINDGPTAPAAVPQNTPPYSAQGWGRSLGIVELVGLAKPVKTPVLPGAATLP